MRKYIKREDAVFAACKVLEKFGGCKMGPLCPDVGCSEVRDIIDTFQMIEIPDQHGRLVDADAIMSGVNDGDDVMFVWAITDAPTIIPAEPPKEEE